MDKFFCDSSAPVQPDQFELEFSQLLGIYCWQRPARVLEIGVRWGGTLYQWLKYAAKGAEVIAVDLPGGSWGAAAGSGPGAAQWLDWADALGVNLHVVLGDSRLRNVRLTVEFYGPIDFLFIDGDHSFGGVSQDFEDYGKLVASGGLVAFHDILPDASDCRIEVWRFWSELKARHQVIELVSSSNQMSRGIGVIRV